MIKLKKYLKPYQWSCIFGAFFKFLEVIFELLLPTLMAFIINCGVLRDDRAYVIQMGLIMLLIACIGYGCSLICQYYASKASQGFGTSLRNKVFEHILSFSYQQLDAFESSTLTTRLTSDINQLQLWVAMMIRLTTRAPFICIGSIVMAFFLDWQLALILLGATPVLAMIIFVATKKAAPFYHTYQKTLDSLARRIKETLSGVRVIRSFSMETKEKEHFEHINDDLMKTGFQIGRISACLNPLTTLTINMVVLLVLWVSGIRIEIGDLSQGEVIAFIHYVNQILLSLLVLSNLILLFTKALASAERVNEVLDVNVEIESKKDNLIPKQGAPKIVFQHVSFGYERNKEMILKDIHFTIEKNEIIGIIGGTGSGKTTLMQLVSRFYDATLGSIYIDGHEVHAYDCTQLQQKIVGVFQETKLFTGTIKDNICLGKEGISEEALEDAIAMAQANDFIGALKDGWKTSVEHGGKNLSGGQKQRLKIARALLRKPEILILDDAESALDYVTASNFRKALYNSDWIDCVCIVSQRVNSIQYADKILVLDDGNMVGFASHEQLMKECQTYIQMYQSQVEATS